MGRWEGKVIMKSNFNFNDIVRCTTKAPLPETEMYTFNGVRRS